MKQNSITLRCIVLMAFFAICSMGFAQVPSGFPTMPNTGNPAADAQAYDQAKTAWFANNPAPTTTNTVVVAPTEVENAAYEAGKNQAQQQVQVERAALQQLNALEAAFRLNQEDWALNNVRLHEAYMTVFSMTRGQTIVSIPAAEYATYHLELKGLIDANTSLFTITQ